MVRLELSESTLGNNINMMCSFLFVSEIERILLRIMEEITNPNEIHGNMTLLWNSRNLINSCKLLLTELTLWGNDLNKYLMFEFVKKTALAPTLIKIKRQIIGDFQTSMDGINILHPTEELTLC